MTYVVTDACIRCKFMDCVAICPVEAFREGKNMLVIDPNDCIDCNACVPECPADAIQPDTEPGLEQWIELNARYAAIWPVVSHNRGQTPDDAEAHKGESGKFELYFSDKPGEGD